MLFPQLGVLVALLNGCTVGTTWERLSLLQDTWGLSCKSGVWCKSYAWHYKLSSPQVLNLISMLLIHEVPGGCARWQLGYFVVVNQQKEQYESKLSCLTSWTKKLPDLKYIYIFFPHTPPFSFPPVLNPPPASGTILTSCDLRETSPLVPKHAC